MAISRYIIVFIIFIIALFFVSTAVADLQQIKAKIKISTEEYQNCVSSLPAGARVSLEDRSSRRMPSISGETGKKISACMELKRTMEDYNNIVLLANDFLSMTGVDSKNTVSEDEATEIATIFVESTRDLNRQFRMGRSSLWHNFLIKVGAREGGYCYQWAEAILGKFAGKRYEIFERHWGVHNKGSVTENNAIIITFRGRPIAEGIVFDPWRGKGAPFWVAVAKDTQAWRELFTETQILNNDF